MLQTPLLYSLISHDCSHYGPGWIQPVAAVAAAAVAAAVVAAAVVVVVVGRETPSNRLCGMYVGQGARLPTA